MALIELTSEERNGKAYAKTILLNTDTIAVPIREVGGKSYIGINESIISGRPSEILDIVYYLVTEDLATVVGLSYDLFNATVITREGRTPSTGYTDLIFRLDRVVGNVAAEGSGSKFMYHEDNGTVPVEFVVSQAPSAIISQVPLPAPSPTPGTQPLVYKALLTQSTISSTSGLLVIGKEYVIYTLEAGDDFANVGYLALNTPFIATGDTPTVWSNGTTVIDIADSAPTAIVLNSSDSNFLGNIVWSYIGVGEYKSTFINAFLQDKYSFIQGAGNESSLASLWAYRVSDDELLVEAYDLGNVGGGFNLSDNILVNQYVLIEVYP